MTRAPEPSTGTHLGPRHRRGVVIVLVVLGLSGCTFFSGLVHTTTALENGGFANATVTYNVNGRSTVTIHADRAKGAGTLGSQAQRAAVVVWQTLPGSFDSLTIDLRGLGRTTFSHDQLAQRLGPRPGNLDAQSLASEVNSQGVLVLVGALAVMAVAVAAVLLVMVSLRRGRRRRTSQQLANMMATLPPALWGVDGTGAGPGWAAAPSSTPTPAPGPAFPPSAAPTRPDPPAGAPGGETRPF